MVMDDLIRQFYLRENPWLVCYYCCLWLMLIEYYFYHPYFFYCCVVNIKFVFRKERKKMLVNYIRFVYLLFERNKTALSWSLTLHQCSGNIFHEFCMFIFLFYFSSNWAEEANVGSLKLGNRTKHEKKRSECNNHIYIS